MKYLIWSRSQGNFLAKSAESANSTERLSIGYAYGMPFRGEWRVLKLNIPSQRDTFCYGSHLIVSGRLKNKLQAIKGANIEFLDTDVQDANCNKLEYFVFNPVDRLDCIDREKSECRYRNDWICEVKQLRLDYQKIDGRAMFVPDRCYTSLLCMRKSIAEELLLCGFDGLGFFTEEEY